MAVYYNGKKILDLRTGGLDNSNYYTKKEIDVKLQEYAKNISAISNSYIEIICDGKNSIRVSATTGDIGLANPGETALYTAAGEIDIGTGWTDVTIDSNNEIIYDSKTGIAKFKIYSGLKNTKVYATIIIK